MTTTLHSPSGGIGGRGGGVTLGMKGARMLRTFSQSMPSKKGCSFSCSTFKRFDWSQHSLWSDTHSHEVVSLHPAYKIWFEGGGGWRVLEDEVLGLGREFHLLRELQRFLELELNWDWGGGEGTVVSRAGRRARERVRGRHTHLPVHDLTIGLCRRLRAEGRIPTQHLYHPAYMPYVR